MLFLNIFFHFPFIIRNFAAYMIDSNNLFFYL